MTAGPGAMKTLEAFTEAFNTGDFKVMETLFARTGNILGIGTDPNEWWSSRELLMSVIAVQLEELAGTTLQLGETVGSDRWVAVKCAIAMPDGNEVPARLTLVSADDGRIEHFHLSVGVPNEELFSQALTT